MAWRIFKRLLASIGCLIFVGLGGAILLGYLPRSAMVIQGSERGQVQSAKRLILWAYDNLGQTGAGLCVAGFGVVMFVWAWATLALPKDKP